MSRKLLGVDTGGTFTDFVFVEDGRLNIFKVLSTPGAPERAILQGVQALVETQADLRMIHGSTVATNAVLEGKGVETAYVANHGFGDVLSIGRQNRGQLYALEPEHRPLPVPPQLCLETGGRLSARGEVLLPLTEVDLAELRARLLELKPRAVAINLLFSYLDEAAEKAIEAVIPEGVFVARSSEVLPEYREYERGIATWLNAYVGPLMQDYLTRLENELKPARVAVMQSSGETLEAGQAARRGVRLLLSGPAGGLMAARHLGRLAGIERLMTFDIGGTSTDVALIDGDIELTSEGRIGDYPVVVPMVDMHTIGAGGGSIARVDAGGLLQVGPQSAGARPGPACYGQGGVQATVTDANLVLGRLLPHAFLGGDMTLDAAAARAAVGDVAKPLGLGVEEAAAGVVRLANEHMAQALRVISIQRGHDPAEFTLFSFGGGGGLHVCELADALGMPRAMVPVHAGVLSALGMLVAPPGRQLSRTHLAPLAAVSAEQLDEVCNVLFKQAEEQMAADGYSAHELTARASLDLRYQGQSHTLNIPWEGKVTSAEAAYHAAHEARFGHDLAEAVELVNVRLSVTGPVNAVDLPAWPGGEAVSPYAVTEVWGQGEVPVFDRAALVAGQTIEGPALVTEQVSTTWLAPGWRLRVDERGNLLLTRR